MSNDLAQSSKDFALPSGAVEHSANYTYTFANYQALREAKRKLNPVDQAIWQWRYAWVLGFNLVFLAYTIWSYGLTAEQVLTWDFLWETGPLFLGLLAFVYAVDLLFDQVLARWVFKRFAMADKPIAVKFTDSKIAWSSEGIQGEFDWAKIIKLVMVRDYLFLFISKMEAIGVSRRAVSSDDAFDSLVTYAKERVNG
jgi:hypothetical protein